MTKTFPTGVKVGVVQATDKDDPNTDHARFIFKIIAGGGNFAIDSNTGVITTKTNTLDREVSLSISMLIIYFYVNEIFWFTFIYFSMCCLFSISLCRVSF